MLANGSNSTASRPEAKANTAICGSRIAASTAVTSSSATLVQRARHSTRPDCSAPGAIGKEVGMGAS
ncbi:MAG: hypothetical protein ACK6D2_20515 [Planctomycetota bacterium]